MTHLDLEGANQETNNNEIIRKWYSLGYIYDEWFWLKKPWLQLNEK